NSEVAQEFINSIEDGGWEEVVKSIKSSDELLKATLNCDEEKVADLIDKAHSDNTSILKYNDENSLSCVISIAYYSARKTYAIERELPAGKGYADLVFRPRMNNSNPALIVELKYDKSAEGAIAQIHQKKYVDCLKSYSGEILLVGINYDKDSKSHTCKIEKVCK
ncbi:MAG: PD-(D/E)XK nuclease domain-containing protein, partial [Alistipes sp.]|nr:PD-(D/E)XK nuclease domain-containing protein [Alistipes sp.]